MGVIGTDLSGVSAFDCAEVGRLSILYCRLTETQNNAMLHIQRSSCLDLQTLSSKTLRLAEARIRNPTTSKGIAHEY